MYVHACMHVCECLCVLLLACSLRACVDVGRGFAESLNHGQVSTHPVRVNFVDGCSGVIVSLFFRCCRCCRCRSGGSAFQSSFPRRLFRYLCFFPVFVSRTYHSNCYVSVFIWLSSDIINIVLPVDFTPRPSDSFPPSSPFPSSSFSA
jgi:hypothetical protein